MDLKAQRAALLAAAQNTVDTAKAAQRELTKDEQADLEVKFADINKIDAQIAESAKSQELIKSLAGLTPTEDPASPELLEEAGPLGMNFTKSAAFQSFKKNHPLPVEGGVPIRIEAKGLGGFAELGIGTKATLMTTTGQWVGHERLPGYRSELLDQKVTFLDLVTTGSTNATFIEYARIVSETNNAAIVPEGELKPLSDLATDKADAKAYTYADGFDITNQTLADEGALATYMQSRIKWHLRNKVEDVLINGGGVGGPAGILTTSGVQTQTFTTDVITTLANALQKVENVQVDPQAIVMNPADIWKLRLLKETGVGYLLGNPFQQEANARPFGVTLVPSTRIAQGKAVVGNFGGVQLLIREALSVVAFNQHKDYAQRNMTYVRAELRALQFIYAPREIVVADIA